MTAAHHAPDHRFTASTNRDGRPLTAEVQLSDMQGVPMPWSLFQGALEFMLQHWSLDTLFQAGSYEDAVLVHPDTGLETEEILAVTHRRQPADRTAGCLEARLAFPVRSGWSHDPSAPPVTRVHTRILQDSAWHQDAHGTPTATDSPQEFARRIARDYGIETARPQEAPRKSRAELEWDLEHGMAAAPALAPARAMLQELLTRLPAAPPL